MADSVKAFFAELQNEVDASRSAGMNAVYQFDIAGDDGGKWYAKLADGSVEIGEGEAENPNITLSAKDEDFLNLINGKMNGQTAFLTGKLKIQGDMTLAMKLESLFDLG